MRPLLARVGVASSLAVFFAAVGIHPAGAATYSVVDLGTLGGQFSDAYAINEAGVVVGQADAFDPGTRRTTRQAFVFDGLSMRSLIPTTFRSLAFSINERGAIAGNYQGPTALGSGHAFTIDERGFTDLGGLPGFPESLAMEINDEGDVVGTARASNGGQRAFSYTDAGMTNLGLLAETTASNASGINNAGAVVGRSYVLGGSRSFAFLASPTGSMEKLNLPFWGSTAFDISERGHVVGTSWDSATLPGQAFLYLGGTAQRLGMLPGAPSSSAGAVNDHGSVVGSSGGRAFLFDGSLVDLNSRIPSGSGWRLTIARDINNAGQIVGFGINPAGQGHAFLLNPDQELSTPRNTRPPEVVGSPEVGIPTLADIGAWEGSDLSFEYRWRRCTDAAFRCRVLAGPTGTTHIPSIYDLGLCLQFVVIATNRAGSTEAASPPACTVRMPTTPEFTAALGYRPHLRFDSAEPQRPLNVNFLFDESGHRLCNDIDFGSDSCSEEGPIIYYACGIFGSSCFPDPDLPDLERFDYIDLSDALATDVGVGPGSAVYYNLSRFGPYYYFDYWFFYRHNAGPFWPDHEGDWEGIVVASSSLDTSKPPLFVSFAQHEGEPARYLTENLVWHDGTHVEVDVALGSHASYPRPCVAAICKQDGRTRPEGRFDGLSAWGWNGASDCGGLCVLPLPEANIDPAAMPPTSASWASWGGLWGRRDLECSTIPGCSPPRSPGTQARYREPWAWRSSETFGAARSLRATTQQNQAGGCEEWFGYAVAAIVCDGESVSRALEDGGFEADGLASMTLRRSGHPAASAPGIAQLIDNPLVTGDVLDVVGMVDAGAIVAVRVASADGDAVPFFIGGDALGLDRGGEKALVVRERPDGTLAVGVNALPTCDAAAAVPSTLWPPNKRMRLVRLEGITDPDGDPVSIAINAVRQDEPVSEGGFAPDAARTDRPDEVLLRAERLGDGDGRVYRVDFSASDGIEECSGTVVVDVGHDASGAAIESEGKFDSFASQ